MKKYRIKSLLQRLFGFRTYLFVYALYGIRRTLQHKCGVAFAYFIDLIPNRGIVLDIGANIGITAVPLARLKKKIDLHAYEPIKENFSTLKRVAALYRVRNLKLFNLALGNISGDMKMIMPVTHKARQQGLSKIYQEGSQEKGNIYTVPVNTLDNIYKENENITAIKIGVGNFEYEVLLGARRLLERCRPIIYCELWKNEKRAAVFDLLNGLGYKTYVYYRQLHGLALIKNNYRGNVCNFFFLPPPSRMAFATSDSIGESDSYPRESMV